MSLSFSTFADDYSTAAKAVRAALASGYRIDKAADPTEGARAGLTEEEAIEVAGQDASLLSLTKANLRAAINALPADDTSAPSRTAPTPWRSPAAPSAATSSIQDWHRASSSSMLRGSVTSVDALRIVASWS